MKKTILLILCCTILYLFVVPLSSSPLFQGDPFDCNQVTDIPLAECNTLVALYTSTNGDSWLERGGSSPPFGPTEWLTDTSACTWYGIMCNGGRVSQISLSSNNLTGSLPDLSSLTYLSSLDLNDNQLTGSLPNLSGLTILWILNLSNNDLTGPVSAISNLTGMTFLNLGNNQLTGSIPNLSSLPYLTVLTLSNNDLTGSISNLSNLPSLAELYLNDNQLSGPISNLSGLTNLEVLDLSGNQFTDSIPTLSNLIKLRDLDLSNNQLTGSIPELSNLGSLWRLNLGDNQLTGNIRDVSTLPGLTYLALENNQLTGTIPDMPAGDGMLFIGIVELTLNGNRFVGEIPPTLATLPNLTVLDLGYNMLTSTNPTLISFLNTIDPDWADTQTIPVTDLVLEPLTEDSVQLDWTPIQYQSDGGYYEILYSANPMQWTVVGNTLDKTASTFTIDSVSPAPVAYFCVKSYTPAHDLQQTGLTSGCSSSVAYGLSWLSIREQELQYAIDGQLSNAPNFDFVLVDSTESDLNFTVRTTDGTVGRISILINDNGSGILTLQNNAITVNGAVAPSSYVQTINSELPSLIVAGLTSVLDERYGIGNNLQNMELHDAGLNVTVEGVELSATAPSGLVATAVSSYAISLAWDDNTTDELHFIIERSSDDGSIWSEVGTVSADVTSFSDISVLCNITYNYRVRAYNGSVYTAFGFSPAIISPCVPLLAPTNLVVNVVSSTQVDLSWSDNSNGETDFIIKRSNGGNVWSEVGTVGADVTTFSDTSVSAIRAYYYHVRAYHSGNDLYSNPSNVAGDTSVRFYNGSSGVTRVYITLPNSSPAEITITNNSHPTLVMDATSVEINGGPFLAGNPSESRESLTYDYYNTWAGWCDAGCPLILTFTNDADVNDYTVALSPVGDPTDNIWDGSIQVDGSATVIDTGG